MTKLVAPLNHILLIILVKLEFKVEFNLLWHVGRTVVAAETWVGSLCKRCRTALLTENFLNCVSALIEHSSLGSWRRPRCRPKLSRQFSKSSHICETLECKTPTWPGPLDSGRRVFETLFYCIQIFNFNRVIQFSYRQTWKSQISYSKGNWP